MKKRELLIYIILASFMLISTRRIIDIAVDNHSYYLEEYVKTVGRLISGPTAPRGRILDVNGKVLVDNIGVNTVVYNRLNGSNATLEVESAYKLGEVLKFDESKFTDYKLKTFYIITNDGCKDLITEEEWDLYEKRKLTSSDLEALKYERITEEALSEFTYEDRNASYIYYLLSTGYFYEDKVIKKGLSDEEVVAINDLAIPGVSTVMSWERTYPYGDTLKTIFGSISTNGVPLEYKEYYESLGINQNSTVGISYLEFEYDAYLRGTDSVYKLTSDGTLELVSEEKSGDDLYLSIDIDKQLEIESILKTEMLNAKKAKNTEFYNHSYVIVGNPNTGEIIAALGLQLNTDHFVDITASMIASSYTVGSIVKGATISVGYANNLIEEGVKVKDSCIKVYGVAEKCSWKSLGYIDDVQALALSSNYYQFLIATRLTNPNYTWNSKLDATEEHFEIYRDMLASYGLGAKTGIDLPNETIGIIGKTVSDDLLLNLTIGQYDTYTPIEVFQYINTIANDGVRVAPSLMKKIVDSDGNLVIERQTEVLNEVPLSASQIERIQTGLREVMVSGTGKNYTDKSVTSAGKTGTSETFVDTDGDKKMDTKTISTAFVMYAPFENPEYSIVIMSPNISRSDGSSSYKYSLNLRVNKKIVKYLFENS